ncbi:hypothetical protein Nm8I071_23130 [Nonomuraea sp. TT08I-71]|nr:hypothetical protein Nm8I071_23130 [Nonomuraea sp. TT08I-71]
MTANSRNGMRWAALLTEIEPAHIDMRRGWQLGPVIVRKRQGRLTGVDHVV